MKKLTLEIPDNISLDEQEAKTILAAHLFESATLSLGQAAEFAGYSKRDFMCLLGEFNTSIFNISESDLENDILNAQRFTVL